MESDKATAAAHTNAAIWANMMDNLAPNHDRNRRISDAVTG
ncbi:MAG: hypothetical protein AAGF11_22235 [Myxococcota bacterium]